MTAADRYADCCRLPQRPSCGGPGTPKVTATTRSSRKFDALRALGADTVAVISRVRLVAVVVPLGASSMIVVGVWGRLDPAGLADWAGWPHHEHFLHDAGVFQVAIGLMMASAP